MTHPQQNLRHRVYHLLGGDGRGDEMHDLGVMVVDRFLVWLILLNCIFSMMETVESLTVMHDTLFHLFDVCSVGIFSVEYALRVWTAVEDRDERFHDPIRGRLRFIFSPLALVDLLAILPFYFGMFVDFDLRAIRVLRLLRILKLTRHSEAMSIMAATLRQESRAISAVLFVFVVILVFVSSLIYLVEHPVQPQIFSDVPTSMWWAVVTMTTLGYGDMVPVTALGRIIGGITAVIGVGMIALPAGVMASGFSEQMRLRREKYMEKVEDAIEDGPITPRERRHLDDTRTQLGLTEEQAAMLLKDAVENEGAVCPHCGKRRDRET
jgi:voltage-gated potassium channel